MTDTPTTPTKAVVYGALSKSSDDPDQTSIASQIEKVRATLASGAVVVGAFSDDGYSGHKGDRGPGLQAAIDAACTAADEHGSCELWANTSARFARGSGWKDEARSLQELSTAMRRRGVILRTVEDDDLVSPMLVGIGSEIAAKYSRDLSESVKRSKLRMLARGDHLGGPVCDGYRIVADLDDSGRVTGRSFIHDPDRADIIRLVFALAAEGVPDAVIARRLNADGLRTRKGRPYDRRAIQNTVTNPFYAGRIAYKRATPDEQITDGKHPPLVAPATFDAIQAARAGRDLGVGQHSQPTGRPALNHALAKLARCGRCGERMAARTSSYRRKDGSRARSYACQSYVAATGVCDGRPVDAEMIDRAVVGALDTLLVDIDGYRQRIIDGHATDRARMADEISRAQRDLDAQADRTAKVEARWSRYVADGEDASADLVLPILAREREALAGADRRLTAARDALAGIPADAPTDAILDFANALQDAIRGRLDRTNRSMGEVNQALREMFDCFVISDHDSDGDGFYSGVLVQPVLRAGAVAPLTDWPVLAKHGDDPPLRWLSTPAPAPKTARRTVPARTAQKSDAAQL